MASNFVPPIIGLVHGTMHEPMLLTKSRMPCIIIRSPVPLSPFKRKGKGNNKDQSTP